MGAVLWHEFLQVINRLQLTMCKVWKGIGLLFFLASLHFNGITSFFLIFFSFPHHKWVSERWWTWPETFWQNVMLHYAENTPQIHSSRLFLPDIFSSTLYALHGKCYFKWKLLDWNKTQFFFFLQIHSFLDRERPVTMINVGNNPVL